MRRQAVIFSALLPGQKRGQNRLILSGQMCFAMPLAKEATCMTEQQRELYLVTHPAAKSLPNCEYTWVPYNEPT